MKYLALAAGLLLCTPVLASGPDYTHNGQTPDNSGSGAGPIDAMEGGLSYRDNCRQLIERASHLTDPTAPDAAEDARHEMGLARDAQADGDFRACKEHAMQAIRDRT